MLAISRFTHNLAILYRAGIPILQSLSLCQGLIGNRVVEKAVLSVEEAVKAGSTISEALRRQPIFPPLLLRMVVMGETTGNLDHALEKVSEYYGEIIPSANQEGADHLRTGADDLYDCRRGLGGFLDLPADPELDGLHQGMKAPALGSISVRAQSDGTHRSSRPIGRGQARGSH